MAVQQLPDAVLGARSNGVVAFTLVAIRAGIAPARRAAELNVLEDD
jgi:ABC-type lipoprotein release transport system permease subunit